ncbi:MAG: 5-formyltetrahydrofolate cyclo-ligase, partial [Methyloprofundus sp.]|nr:5-formyltetrahydrofolate cyclo-ligase [Methyloprofundus sp.]
VGCVVVPGVAFDQQGGRLGNGAGYYDRLFTRLKADCQLMGICFNSQLVEQVCMQKYDIYMDKVITETGIYKGRGR